MKTKHFISLALVAILVLGFTSSAVAGSTWNATDEFSVDNGNPNGAWSYGWMDSDFTTFTLFSETRDTTSDPAWHNTILDSVLWFNNTGATRNGVPDGWLSLSPPNGGQNIVLRWVAPEGVDGLVRVTGEFLAGDTASMSLAIFSGDTKTPESTLWSGTDSGSFDLGVNVTEGDILNFTIFGHYYYGNTPIAVAISAVPEPSATALLIGAGTLALAFARRRFRKK